MSHGPMRVQPVLLGSQPQGVFMPAEGVSVAPSVVQTGMMAAVHPGTQAQAPLLHHGHAHKLGMRRQPVVMSPWVQDPIGFATVLEHVHEGDETEADAGNTETPPNSPTNGKMDMS